MVDQRRRNGSIWIAIAVLFGLLAVSRVTDFENSLRAALRMWLAAEGEYDVRRTIQAPLAAALLIGGGLAGLALAMGLRPAGSGRANRALAWATRSAVVMLGLVALRLVSLHATDALLYKPVHLNWLIDIGATLVVAGCAWIYCDRSRRQSARRTASADRTLP